MKRSSGIWRLVGPQAIPCLLPAALLAQQDTAVFRVGEVVVQATRPVTTIGGASALEVRVDSIRLNAAPTLEQVLRALPLMQVRTNSRGEAQFSLRGSGSDARQVAVLIDGVPLHLGWDDRADLAILPTTAAQSITVSRGLPSVLYGPNVLGGVVEIGVSRGAIADMNPRALVADAGSGQVGAYSVSAALTLPFGLGSSQLLVRTGGGYRERRGVPLPDEVREPDPGPDPDLRLNTDLVHRDAFAAVRLQSRAGSWAALTASGFSAERGIPAELHIADARFWRYPVQRRGLAVIAGGTGERKSPLGGIADVEMSFGLDAAHTEIDQYGTRSYDMISGQEDSEDSNVSIRMRADQTVTRSAELHAALTYADLHHDETLTPGGPASYRQRLWSAAAEVSSRAREAGALAHARFSAGIAYDGADTPESGDKPALGTLQAWGARAGFTALVARGSLLLHGGLSRRARFPALRELYSGALGRFEPNPGLHPETLVAAEAGATLGFGRGELQLVSFHHRLDDAIVRIALPDRRFTRVNRDRQTASGVELLANAAAAAIRASAELTLQHTRLADDTGAESEAEYQPGLLAGANLTVALARNLRLDVRARHTGRQTCLNAETNTNMAIDASNRLDVELGKRWPARSALTSALEVALAADNLGDAAIYDQCGLPQPGRTVRLQVRVR